MASILSRPQCLNSLRTGDAYVHQYTRPSLVQIMAGHLVCAKWLTNAGLLSIRAWGKYFNEISFEIQKFSIMKMCMKISLKWWPFCLGLNVLNVTIETQGHAELLWRNRHCKNSNIRCTLVGNKIVFLRNEPVKVAWIQLNEDEHAYLISLPPGRCMKSFKKIEWICLPAYHDKVIKWKNFPHYCPFVWGIHRSSVNSLHKGQWCGGLMFSLICTWING